MPGYNVRWEMDVEADSPREAAERAREAQTREGTIANVFDVFDGDGRIHRIDLDLIARIEGTD